MKRTINILLSATMLLVISSCADELPLDELLSETEFGIALRNIEEINGLDLDDLNSTYTLRLELDQVDGGLQAESIRVLVGFTDDDAKEETDTEPEDPANSVDPTIYVTNFNVASFTETTDITTHGLDVGTFTATLTELLAHLSLSEGDYDRGDVIDIEFEVIADNAAGTVFNKDNVGANVAAAGRFSFYNSPFEFTAMIDDPNRIVLEDASLSEFSNSSLISGDTDTVVLDWDGSIFATNATITRTSAGGFTDDSFGAGGSITTTLQAYPGDEDGDDLFFFLYTAGSADSDKVSFTISGAESTSGFEMEQVTFSNAFTIDNVNPGAILGGTTIALDDEGAAINRIDVDLIFSEELSGDVTYTITSDQFDTVTFDQEVSDDVASISFNPKVDTTGDVPAGSVTFTVAASGTNNSEGIDVAGNAVIASFNVTAL